MVGSLGCAKFHAFEPFDEVDLDPFRQRVVDVRPKLRLEYLEEPHPRGHYSKKKATFGLKPE